MPSTKSGSTQKNTKKPAASGSAKPRKTPVRVPEAKPETKKEKPSRDPSGLLNQILPFVFFVGALLFTLILILDSDAGVVVKFLQSLLLGVFSGAAFAIPVLMILLGIYWRSDIVTNRTTWKFWCAGISLVMLSVLMHIFLSGTASYNIKTLYVDGSAYKSGGVIGGLLGSLFLQAFGKTISLIILFSALFVLSLLLFGLTPRSVYVFFAYKYKRFRENKREQTAARAAAVAVTPQSKPPVERIQQAGEIELPQTPPVNDISPAAMKRMHKFDPDVKLPKTDDDKKSNGTGLSGSESEQEITQDIIDKKIFDEVMRRTRERYGEQALGEQAPAEPEFAYGQDKRTDKKILSPLAAKQTPDTAPDNASVNNSYEDEIDLSKIFVDPDAIELLRRAKSNADIKAAGEGVPTDVTEAELDILPGGDIVAESVTLSEPETVSPEPETPVPVYEFPPLSLLTAGPLATVADLDELKQNAQKLVDTLRSFNVRTRVSDVSHGPTITRYELTPESGTRVKSITNLSEDISLNLATPGVRIEAPIPGKSAVGVEVPNKKRENVYLRALLEAEEFDNLKSRLTSALGTDVAGSPVYCDIASMPHLLVSGATGMGKSVCINSIIVSLLYKSTPKEIRLIMIDPKKVELNIYNGIPHLHVPVVSDPKKAAGTLSWAVTEMERRYEIIEGVGVRNIQNYNDITYNDPEKEFMPQMVIIIDELADLMMTAPDDVEASICRIAQMGRAAGLHLIIGTQRPSVDVITGLIKANIPSRIAFKMASQVDSRTVIDIAGAEKLLGRGDMLYAPVGVMKPLRVQGAFVSEAEVGKITDFLKGICPVPQYDAHAIDGIEEAAARCGQKKGRGGALSGDDSADTGAGDDPMLKQALELAVESGKISTSLIQRRLSLGYGRAAKLIDRMESLGYVSAPDGQRPREVLISRQQYQELVLRDELD